MVFGTFDLLHPGHMFLINEARRRGRVVAVVARDETVERIKGRLPVQAEGMRREAIESRYPDVTAVPGSRTDFLDPVRIHKPDILLLGYDQQFPPGVTAADIPCTIVRAAAHRPEQFKSSLMKKQRRNAS